MKIAVLIPKNEFLKEQQRYLSQLGQVIYVKSREEHALKKLIKLTRDSEILAADPDVFGGFEKAASGRLTQLMEAMSKLKAVVLASTSFSWIDLDYCRKRKIVVTNVPYYSTESVAEHALALMLGCAKRIFITDRRTKKGKYRLEMGFELKGKTLGIIGLGHIGTRTAELGMAVGMKVIAWNRASKEKGGVEMKSLEEVLIESDVISLHLAENEETKDIISKERIAKLKDGVIIINTADRSLVDEEAMAEALKSGKVDSYALEAEGLTSTPLGGIENAILFRGFGWFTKEALERNKEIWVNNIEGIVKGKPINVVS